MKPQWQRKYEKLMVELSQVGFVCNGTLRETYQRCGKPSCACATDDDQKHGPYYIWTATNKGKQTCRSFSKTQARSFDEYNRNYQKMKALVEQLCTLVVCALLQDKQ